MNTIILTESQYETFADIVLAYEGYPRSDYSGRGMFGQTCLGADFDSEYEWMECLDELKESFPEITWNSFSTDSMGLGRVYYWRGVQVENA